MVVRKVAQRIPFTPSKTQAALLEQCLVLGVSHITSRSKRLTRTIRTLILAPSIRAYLI